MAMINCPECGKEVSDQAKTCPNCGVKIKKKKNTKAKLAITVVICFLMLGCSAVATYLYINYRVEVEKNIVKAKQVESKIEEFFSYEHDNSLDIVNLKSQYDLLPDNVKKYVSNSSMLSEYKVELTADNFCEFFTLQARYSDTSFKSSVGWIGTEYTGYCTQTVSISPNVSLKCNNVSVAVSFNDVGLWYGRDVAGIKIDENGCATDEKEIESRTSSIKVDKPYDTSSYTVTRVSGYITFE